MADKWFYLSFATDDGHRGSTVIADAESPEEALALATERGLNPGGEVMSIAVPAEFASTSEEARGMIGRLVLQEELIEAGGVRLGDMEEMQRKLIETCSVLVCKNCNDEGNDGPS